ncbi:Zn-dependent protease with chaperone function [Candidatus Methanoperedens nitroreducens]|uniref:Zn-dependent protease with chaperone function n=1 Tax=Candidatus Methanoperedens nitratireducens TaxID=1392998 RepID=A0A062UVS1_9EURY|nr:M48 family metalloprotease [Candidatus Methanoperedens nitroreducens]KCZ71121.1 Zn-dependent protease with chaperone function [Candidatus Methanoperedens nitroreducens]MDJ1421501.1 M48 family metalloprotease [Candidatus Methanoperedens sp.]
MSENDRDNVHRIHDELVQSGLISSNIKLKKNDFINKLSGNTIYYTDNINKVNDDAVVLFIGHEYGHYILPQVSLVTIISVLILSLVTIIFLISSIVLAVQNKYVWYIFPFFVALFLISKWLHEDEYRSDIIGAMILREYGRIKGREASPSKSLAEAISVVTIQDSSIDYSIKDRMGLIIQQKLDFFFHPPNLKRIEKLRGLNGINKQEQKSNSGS